MILKFLVMQEEETCAELLDDKSRRLIEYAMKHSPKSYFWQSQGEIRFLMLKRFMDVYYASIGTAIASSGSDPDSMWKMPLIAGAAASFYSITGTGASIKASHVVNKRSRDLIQHAWYVFFSQKAFHGTLGDDTISNFITFVQGNGVASCHQNVDASFIALVKRRFRSGQTAHLRCTLFCSQS